jgi:hypothetical protein
MSKFDEAIPAGAVPERSRKKVGDSLLKFKPTGSVEDAKKAMIAAGQQPGGPNAKLRAVDNLGGIEADEVTVIPPVVVPPVIALVDGEFEDELEVPEVSAKPAATAPVPPVVAPPPAQPQRIERVENDKFVAEMRQENGKWVAEIKYKNGAGTERFIADTKGQLTLKLLEGKGHATLRVNKAVRREKLGFSELDKQYPLPEGITAEDFEKMDDKSQDAVLWSVANNQGFLFKEQHPDYYATDGNKEKLLALLSKAKLPITARNLAYALDELSDPNLPLDVRLEERPAPVMAPPLITSLAPDVPTTPPARTDSAPVVAAPAPVPTAAPAAAPGVTVRKKGTTGLRPGDSSVETAPGAPEDGQQPRQPSEADLRKMPLTELRRIARSEWKQPNRV